MKIILLVALFVVASSFCLAVDRLPTYDYANGIYNLTLTNSPSYNVTTRSYEFNPTGNMKATFAKNMTTSEFPLNTTPFSVLAYVTERGYEPSGAATTLAVFKGYNFTNNTGYEVKFMMNSSGHFRTQFLMGATFVTGTFTANYSLNQPIPIAFVFNGSQCWSYVGNSSGFRTDVNASCTGKNASVPTPIAIPDALCGEGTAGGSSNGMCNATIKNVLIFNRTITASEFTDFIGNKTLSNNSLLANWTFENTTSTNITINLSSALRVTPQSYIGMHSSPSPIASPTWCDDNGDGTFDVACNQTEATDAFNQTGISLYDFVRKPIDFSNIVASLNMTTGVATWNFITGSGQNYKNLNIHKDLLQRANASGKYVIWNVDDIPLALADNDSECNYGLATSGPSVTAVENQERCDPTSYTIYNQVKAQFLYDVGCYNYTYNICAVESFNEYYLGQFYNRNTTALPESGSCPARITKVLDYWNQTGKTELSAAITARGDNPNIIRWFGSPAFTNESSSCGNAMGNAWVAAYPYGSTDGADYLIEHTYTSQCTAPTTSFQASIAANEATAALGGYTSHWGITEFNIICQSLNTIGTNNSQYGSYLAQNIFYMLTNSTSMFAGIFKDTSITTATGETSQYYFAFRGVNLTNNSGVPFYTGAYSYLNGTKYLRDNASLYTCTSGNSSSLVCIFQRVNRTNGYLFSASKLNNQLDIDFVNLTNANITSATQLLYSSAQTVSAGLLDPGYLGVYDYQVYNLTISTSDISFNGISANKSIVEPDNVVFSFNISNPSSVQYNINWSVTGGQNTTNISSCFNATSCTFTGNYTASGNYVYWVSVVGETNTLQTNWTLQVNNSNENVSISSVSPSGNPMVNIGSSQAFSFVLNNRDSVSNTTQWFSDNTNVTACYNLTSCTVTGASVGTKNISFNVSTPLNNVSYSWLLTVESTAASYSRSICQNNAEGVLTFSRLASSIAAIVILSIIVALLLGGLGYVNFFEMTATQLGVGILAYTLFVILAGVLVTILTNTGAC